MPVLNSQNPDYAICDGAVPAMHCLAVSGTVLGNDIPGKLPADPEEPFLGVTTADSTGAGAVRFQATGIAQVQTEDAFLPRVRLVMEPGGKVRAVRPAPPENPGATIQSVGISLDRSQGAEGNPDIVGMLIQPTRVP